MRFTPTALLPACVVDLEPHEDARGWFARSWCQREFAANGLNSHLAQCNISRNNLRGTLRGMHYQAAPHAEAKLVRCTGGAIFDVIIDLRPDSPTYCQHFGMVLSADNGRALYVPEGFAHGFLTLAEKSDVLYQMSQFFEPAAARGVRWNDPAFGISWPEPVKIMSDRDRTFPDYVPSGQVTGGIGGLTHG